MKVIASLCLATITGCVAPPEPSRDSRHDWSAKPTGACSADVEDDRLYAPPGAKVTLQTMGRRDYHFDGDDEHGQVIEGHGFESPRVLACREAAATVIPTSVMTIEGK